MALSIGTLACCSASGIFSRLKGYVHRHTALMHVCVHVVYVDILHFGGMFVSVCNS